MDRLVDLFPDLLSVVRAGERPECNGYGIIHIGLMSKVPVSMMVNWIARSLFAPRHTFFLWRRLSDTQGSIQNYPSATLDRLTG